MPPKSASRIPIVANQAVTGTLFGLAILAAITRAYIRARILKQLAIEDGILLFAVICLCATTVLSYVALSNLYNALDVILLGSGTQLGNLLNEVSTDSKEQDAAATLWWLVIFPVKLAYLFFFRKLILRLRALNIWWWCVIAFMVPASVMCFVITYLACPSNNVVGILIKCSGPSAEARQVHVTAVTTVFDVMTDIMVVSFPVALLWKVRINMRQKLGLGSSLCLSLVMAIVAIVRISGIRLPAGELDIVWLAFWQQQESSIAVIMVSLTAFRSLFVADASRQVKRPRYTPSYWKKKKMAWNRHKTSDDLDDPSLGNLPAIPSATMTGLKTFIRGEPKSSRLDEAEEHEFHV